MRKLTKLSILLASAGLCAALIGCQQGTDKKGAEKKAEATKPANGQSVGAKIDSALEKTKDKAQEVGAAAKDKAQDLGSAAKEKTQEISSATREKIQDIRK